MQKILNQDEIDALVQAAHGSSGKRGKANKTGPTVVDCDFRRAGQISNDHVRSMTMLHESMARNLTHSLGAYLRVVFEFNLVSLEQLRYSDALQLFPEVTYVASVKLEPLQAIAVVQVDLALAFPIIDLLLGGQGKPESQLRDITDIEEQILESVVKLICRELQTAWQPLGLEFTFDQRQNSAQVPRLMSPGEKVLAMSFEAQMPEVHGSLAIIIPSAASSALLRKLSQQWDRKAPRASIESGALIREKLLDCNVEMELALSPSRLPLSRFLGLSAGDLLVLQHNIENPAVVSVAGREMFAAVPVSKGRSRAAEILQRVSKPTIRSIGMQ